MVNQLGNHQRPVDAAKKVEGAKVIGVYDAEGKRQGSIKLSHLKVKSKAAPLYSFGVLTDVHFGVPRIDPETDFTRALDFFHAEGSKMVSISGDISRSRKSKNRLFQCLC